MDRTQLNEIIDLVNPRLADMGAECIEVEWDSKQKILRLFIDRPGGVVIEDCVTASRLLEEFEGLDQRIEGAYNLEVSSPGVERPLRTIQHFMDRIGESVEVILSERVDDRKHSSGKIVEVKEETGVVVLETQRGMWSFPIEQVYSCKVKFNWHS